MKGILLIATTLISLISCSRGSGADTSNPDEVLNINTQTGKITPPSWLYGVWEGSTSEYEVKPNDLILVLSFTGSFTEKLSYANSGFKIQEQRATNNEYYLHLVSGDDFVSGHLKFRFVKKGNRVILYQNGDNEFGEELIRK